MKTHNFVVVMSVLFLIFAPKIRAQTLYNNVGHIPAAHQETWSAAGLLQDFSLSAADTVFVITGSADNDYPEFAAALTNAKNFVDDTENVAVIYFPADTLNFDSPISLDQTCRNIILLGAGSDRTTLVFRNMQNSNCINICGTEGPGDWIDLRFNFNKGDSVIYPASGSWEGDEWIHFIVFNYDYRSEDEPEPEIVGQITKIESSGANGNGNYLEIKDVANMNYRHLPGDGRPMRVRKITPIQNIGIEDLKIMRSPHENAYGAAHPFNIYMAYAVNCWVKGVESYKPSCHHLSISRSSHCEVSGCYFHEAMDYCGGGWGYGVELYASTTNCLVENNIFRHLRHSLVAAGGSNCNIWSFNYSREQLYTGGGQDDPTNRDLDLHAKWAFGHLFEQNIVEEIGADANAGNGVNGFYNTFVRNYCYDAVSISIEAMENWSFLGNIRADFDNAKALLYTASYNPTIDLFGYRNNYSDDCTHYENAMGGFVCTLADVSYYYSARPDFLPSTSYSWPAVGTEVNLTQNIPARTRFGYAIKTYCPHPWTSSGYVCFDQTWPNTHTLTGNVFVPSGITLTIASGTTVDLNGYYLKSTGGIIAREGSVTFNPDMRLMNGATLKGQYPSSLSAFNDASSSDELQLYSDETWNTDLTVTANVKVASGKTLSIPAGRTISFNSSRKLEVYGHLDIDGTSVSRVTFKATTGSGANLWQGIWFYGANNGNLDYLTVKNASYGFKLNANSFVTSEYSKFETNGIGIYANSAGAALYHDEYSGNSTAGITAYSTSFTLGFSTVTNAGADGIQTQSASPDIFQTLITGNTVGVRSSGGTIDMGTTCGYPDGGYNSIYSNSSEELWVGSSTTLWALSDWWGQPSVPWGDIYAQGVVNAWCSLSSPPPARLAEMPNVLSRIASGPLASAAELSGSSDPAEMVLTAITLRKSGQYSECEELLKKTILDHPAAEAAVAALWELAKTYSSAPVKGMEDQLKGDLDDFFLNISQIHAPGQKDARELVYRITLRLLAGTYMRSNQYDRAIEICNRICAECPDSIYEEESLYNLFTICFDLLHDRKAAQEVYGRLVSNYPHSSFIIHARIALGMAESLPIPIAAQKIESESGSAVIVQSYPNPFNPVTSIAYTLPKANQVRIEIYNLLGQKVITLADQQMAAGNHAVRWNGRNSVNEKVAAGLYLCRIQIGEIVKAQRMTLLP